MADVNKVILVGRLTRAAQHSCTPSGYSLLKFSIAVNRRRKQGDEWVDEGNFFDVTVYGRQGEAIAQYMTKGKQIAVEGQLVQDRWTAKDGTSRSKVAIEANNIQLLGAREDSTASSPPWAPPHTGAPPQEGPGQNQGPKRGPGSPLQVGIPPRGSSPGPGFEDDIPF